MAKRQEQEQYRQREGSMKTLMIFNFLVCRKLHNFPVFLQALLFSFAPLAVCHFAMYEISNFQHLIFSLTFSALISLFFIHFVVQNLMISKMANKSLTKNMNSFL